MMTFPLNLDHDTLSIHGMMRINGPVAPVVELQARLAARVFANLHQLPSDNRRKVAVDVVNRKQMSVYGRYMYKVSSDSCYTGWLGGNSVTSVGDVGRVATSS